VKPLRIERFGDKVQGVTLRGNPASPEPETVRVEFPGGDVDVVRTSDGSYWVHVRVNRAEDLAAREGEIVAGRLTDARLDVTGKHASETDAGDFAAPGLFHVAVRVAVAAAEATQ